MKKKEPKFWERPTEKGFNHLLGYSLDTKPKHSGNKDKKVMPVNLPKINNRI